LYDAAADYSRSRFLPLALEKPEPWPSAREEARALAGTFYMRNPRVRGPTSVFGYDYLEDKLGAERVSKLRLLRYQGLRGSGGEYAYEVANLAHAALSIQEVRDKVSAIYGPVPLELVEEYWKALESIGIIILNIWSR
jgi:aminopeptidase YwaD